MIKLLASFPNIVQKASNDLKPHLVANYAYSLAQMFNEYYHKHQVLRSEKNTRDARIMLSAAIGQSIKNSLGLLGIEVLEKM